MRALRSVSVARAMLGCAVAFTLFVTLTRVEVAAAASAEELNEQGMLALGTLLESNEAAKQLAPKAKGTLIFPNILRAGLMIGAQIGEGVMFKNNLPTGYYNSVAASYGLQAGIQKYGYALFFLDDKSLEDFESSKGFEIGVGPTVVIVDKGMGKEATTVTAKSGIYGVVFDQKGVMAGVGIKGSKITQVEK